MQNEPFFIRCGDPCFDELIPRVRDFLACDILNLSIDGQSVTGYRSPDAKSLWIRDHSDMMRIGKYFLHDPKSAVQHFADNQSANGRIFDYVTTHPEKLPCERENWTKYVRVPVEADVEFRFIKAAFLAWQATGDDDWIRSLIPNMERALGYIFSHPHRTDQQSGLVKRAYTIDTWDFAYTAGQHPWLQFQIDEDTFWGIFHGDISGYYEALAIMELLYETVMPEATGLRKEIRKKKEEIRSKGNEVCWNGRFYTHFVKLTPVTIDGVNEAEQLSMANPMSINRGLADHDMAVSIIREYQRRKDTTNAFAEWFSIDPPFPDGVFGDEKLVGGAYINGGIFPLAGGELAMAAFKHGFESYGVSILKQYHQLISANNETFLWYFPDGTPTTVETSTSPEATPTDGWGSSAMTWALIEGLAGIVDTLSRFEKIRISPRWLAASITEAEAGIGYPQASAGQSPSRVSYRFRYSTKELILELNAQAEADFHVLIGTDDLVNDLTINGLNAPFGTELIEQSRYVNFSTRIDGWADIRITFKG